MRFREWLGDKFESFSSQQGVTLDQEQGQDPSETYEPVSEADREAIRDAQQYMKEERECPECEGPVEDVTGGITEQRGQTDTEGYTQQAGAGGTGVSASQSTSQSQGVQTSTQREVLSCQDTSCPAHPSDREAKAARNLHSHEHKEQSYAERVDTDQFNEETEQSAPEEGASTDDPQHTTADGPDEAFDEQDTTQAGQPGQDGRERASDDPEPRESRGEATGAAEDPDPIDDGESRGSDDKGDSFEPGY